MGSEGGGVEGEEVGGADQISAGGLPSMLPQRALMCPLSLTGPLELWIALI